MFVGEFGGFEVPSEFNVLDMSLAALQNGPFIDYFRPCFGFAEVAPFSYPLLVPT